MRIPWTKRLYIKRYFAGFDDLELSRALNVDRATVTKFRQKEGLQRANDGQPRRSKLPQQTPPPFDGRVPVPDSIYRPNEFDFATACFAAVAAFIVYLVTLPPTVSGEDSGELITAAYSLGIPHPPGYPAWCLLSHPFIYIPFGSVAWRVALSSAVFGSMAVFFVCLIVLKLTRSRPAAVGAALLFAFSKDAWEQFIIAEVYALNALFIAACIFLLMLWYESRRNAPLLIFAFLYGLSLTNHSTMRLLGPVFLLFILSVDPVPWKRWRLFAGCLGLSLVGLSAFLYLPIRSLANPPIDWGNPETWDNFWSVVRQDQYSFLLTQQARSFSLLGQQLKMFWDYYSTALTPFLAALPLLGIYSLWKFNRHLFFFVGMLAVALSAGMVLALNYGTDRTALVVNDVFFIPFEMLAAILIGMGFAWVAGLRLKSWGLMPAAALLSLAIPVLPLVVHYRNNDKSDYWFAHDYARNVLVTLEPNAIYIPTADHATFPVLYLQAVEKQRPDVAIADKYGYIDPTLYADMPQEIRNTFDAIPSKSERNVIEEWIISHTIKPVYFTEKRPLPAQLSAHMENAGLLYRVVRKDESWQPRNVWNEYEWKSLALEDTHSEFTAGMVLSDYYFARGRDFVAAKDLASAREQFELSANASRGAPEAFNNIGTALAEAGYLDDSANYYFRSVQADTRYVTGLRNLGQVYLSLENYAQALLVFDRLMEIQPYDVQTQIQHAVCLKSLDEFARAKDELLELSKRHPENPVVWRELGMLYLEGFGNETRARQYLGRSLKLNPNQWDLVGILNDPTAGLGMPTFPSPTQLNYLGDGEESASP